MSTAPNGNGVQVTLYTRDKLLLDSSQNANRAQPVVNALINFLTAGNGGGLAFDSVQISPDTDPPASAFCTLTGSSLSGSVGALISGVSLVATAAGGDNASMALVLAVINASSNALIQGIVQAGRNAAATVACASVAAADTVTIAGITLTAVAGTRNFRQFSKDTSDTATGADLVVAILKDPILGLFYTAVNAAGTVSVYPRYASTPPNPLPNELVASSDGTRLAVTQFTTGAVIAVGSMKAGAVGNSISVIATGTGMTLGATASPTNAFASGNKLMQGGAGLNSAIGTFYNGRFA